MLLLKERRHQKATSLTMPHSGKKAHTVFLTVRQSRSTKIIISYSSSFLFNNLAKRIN